MIPALGWITEALQALAADDRLRERRVLRLGTDGGWEFQGTPVIDFASNDYLGLARDPRVIEALREGAAEAGAGARASPLVCGRMPWHAALEEQLARFEGQAEALLFPSGMAANVGTIPALCGSEDLILCDRFNHASLVDGCRLSQARWKVYRHDDLEGLRRTLQRETGWRRVWIVTDGVFSMEGDVAPLGELCDIADRWGAGVIVDEAHGTGVLGGRGRGACEALDVEDRVAVRVGTLSKAIGAQGGFVAGPRALIQYLWNTARTQIYSTGLSPAVCAAASAAVRILEAEPERRNRLAELTCRARQILADARIEFVQESATPILPVILHDADAAVRVAQDLLHRGFLVGAIRPPTVPRGTSRLRLVIHSHHQEADLVRLAETLNASLKGA